MSKKAYIAIDLGAESGRAIVGVLDRDRLTLEEVHRFLHLPVRLPSGLHWDLTGIWRGVLEGTRKAIDWARARDLDVVSLGVDTWGVDCALVGQSGGLLGLPFCYRDERNGPAHDKLIDEVGWEALYAATGIQFMAINTLPQLVAWREAEPELLGQAERLLFMPDLLNFFFTGKQTVEATIASTSQMIDPVTGKWATELLNRVGLPGRMLGEITSPGTPIGRLLPAVAAEVGADDSLTVVATASHDTASAVAAVPADPTTDWCYVSSGTWSLLGAELSEPCTSDAARLAPFTNEGGVEGTIRFLKNIAGLWLVQECRRHYEKHGDVYDYDQLTAMAADAPPLVTLINLDHPSLAVAGDMPSRIAALARETGEPEPTDVGPQIRCCLESLAMTYRHVLARLEEVLDRKFDVLHIVGGGGRNRLLSQMAADATNRRVVVGPLEATAVGNLLVQAMASGDVADLAHIRRIARASFEPETYLPRDPEAWDDAYGRFASLLKQ